MERKTATRLCPSGIPVAFYVSFEDVFNVAETIIDIMENHANEDYSKDRGTVA